MSENTLIIAAAGSGKTTYLVNRALEKTGNVLILTYTLANKDVIKKCLVQKKTCIPPNITVQTWFSFLLQHGVRPYQGCLHEDLYNQKIGGMFFVNKQSALKCKTKEGRPVYFSEQKEPLRYYFTNSHTIYSDKISKFVVKCNEASDNAVINRLSLIYDHLFIDEAQDLAGYDLELLKPLFSSNIATLLACDPRQTIYLTHHARKHKKYSDGLISDFIQEKIGKGRICNINERTLRASYRCNQEICDFSSKLYPDLSAVISYPCCTKDNIEHQGIFLVKTKQALEYLRKYKPIQLRWDRREKIFPDTNAMNFGESKGCTFCRILIYPTKPMIDWIKNNSTKLSHGTRAKFYVGLTRAKHSVAIVMDYDDNFTPNGIKKYISKNAT